MNASDAIVQQMMCQRNQMEAALRSSFVRRCDNMYSCPRRDMNSDNSLRVVPKQRCPVLPKKNSFHSHDPVAFIPDARVKVHLINTREPTRCDIPKPFNRGC